MKRLMILTIFSLIIGLSSCSRGYYGVSAGTGYPYYGPTYYGGGIYYRSYPGYYGHHHGGWGGYHGGGYGGYHGRGYYGGGHAGGNWGGHYGHGGHR